MPITASISIVVPSLPDNDVWFLNSASWTNYWANISGNVTLDEIATTIYAPSAFVDAGSYVMNVDGVEFRLVQEATLTSLLNRVNTLEASYQTLRTELRNAGLIDNAQ